MRRLTSGLLVAAMALAFVAVASTKADAAFILYICDNATCTGSVASVTDNGAGDLNGAAGTITALETGIGGFSTASIETAFSYPTSGSPGSPVLDIAYTLVGAGNVYIYGTNTGFTAPSGTASIVNNGNSLNGAVATSVGQLYGGNSNTNTPTPDITHLILTLNGLNGTITGPFTAGVNPYALALLLHMTVTGPSSGLTTGDLGATIVPEPASLALFGLGMLGVGYMRRRRHA